MKDQKTVILGIGNILLGDEGAGIHALELLQSEYPNIPGVTYVDGGTLSFSLATYFEDCDKLIVFDAAEFKSPPGTVKTLIGDAMDAFLGAAKRSPHEVGLLDLFDIARLTGSLPEKRALIGIQPETTDWSMEPSPAVADALDMAVTSALGLLQIWDIVSPDQKHRPPGLQDFRIKNTGTPIIKQDKSSTSKVRKAV
jgi:hydrogenase maturation protease